MVPEELRKAAQRLNESFRASISVYSLGVGSSPLWYGLMLSDILLVVGDEALVYATGAYQKDDGTAHFAVVTEAMVVDVRFDRITTETWDRDFRAVPFRNLVSVGVEATETVFSSSPYSDWPNQISVTATFDGLAKPLTVPFERVIEARYSERELLTRLIDQLQQGGGSGQ